MCVHTREHNTQRWEQNEREAGQGKSKPNPLFSPRTLCSAGWGTERLQTLHTPNPAARTPFGVSHGDGRDRECAAKAPGLPSGPGPARDIRTSPRGFQIAQGLRTCHPQHLNICHRRRGQLHGHPPNAPPSPPQAAQTPRTSRRKWAEVMTPSPSQGPSSHLTQPSSLFPIEDTRLAAMAMTLRPGGGLLLGGSRGQADPNCQQGTCRQTCHLSVQCIPMEPNLGTRASWAPSLPRKHQLTAGVATGSEVGGRTTPRGRVSSFLSQAG